MSSTVDGEREKKIHEVEDRTKDITQSEQQREN